MSKEQTAEKTSQKNAKTKPEAKVDVISSREDAKVIKAKWTLERCKRYARRYPNEAVWASSASASYKSAVAHGWKDACLNEMEHRPGEIKRAA